MFLFRKTETVDQEAEAESEFLNYENIFTRLHVTGQVHDGLNFDTFATADDDLVTRITYTDAEIVVAVNAPQPVDLDDSDEEENKERETELFIQNTAKAYCLFGRIRRYIETNTNWVDVDLSSLDQVENLISTIFEKKLVQSKITNFFPIF